MWSGIPSIDDYKIKILINSVKHWRYVLGYWIFSRDLILHAEGKENFHVISMQTCFCLNKWAKLQAERELFWNKFSANYSALYLCPYSFLYPRDDVRPSQAPGVTSRRWSEALAEIVYLRVICFSGYQYTHELSTTMNFNLLFCCCCYYCIFS